MDIDSFLLKLKKINTLKETEQREIFIELNKWFCVLSTQDQFSSLLYLRTYFFRFASIEEKDQFAIYVIRIIKTHELTSYQAIELAGIIFKYVTLQVRHDIFEEIFSSSLIETDRGIVSTCSFIKNNNKLFSITQDSIAHKYLNVQKSKCAEYMLDTINCTENHLSKSFYASGDCVFLIPEFQNGSSFLQPPLGLINAATLLISNNIAVDILDNRIYNYPIEEIIKQISNYKLIVVCTSTIDQINTYFVDYRYVISTLYINKIKETYSYIPLIICGAHGTVRSDILLKDCNCDFIIKGEYDVQLATFIRAYLAKENINSFPNIVYKDSDGRFIETKKDYATMHPQNWCVAQPDYELICLDAYFGYAYKNNMHLKKMHWSIVQASRGCPYNCAFCYNFYDRKVRYRTVDSVFQELETICKAGVEEIFFLDQIFTINEDFVLELCHKIRNAQLKLKWQCQTRVDLINRAVVREMKAAGCETIWLGIESFDEGVIYKNNKNYKHEDLLEAINIIEQEGLTYNAFIMLGMMGETRDTLKKTINMIKKHRIRLTKSIMICTPRFDTIMYEEFVKQYGYEINSFLELDSYKGRINNSVTEADLNTSLNTLLSIADEG